MESVKAVSRALPWPSTATSPEAVQVLVRVKQLVDDPGALLIL